MVPDRREGRIRFPLLDEDADDRQPAFRRPVHQVHLHGETPAAEGVLARAVEVVLQQREGLSGDREAVGLRVVHLDRVPGVLHVGLVLVMRDPEDGRSVRSAHLRHDRRSRGDDVDRRLTPPFAAGAEFRAEPAPRRRPGLLPVVPMRASMLRRCSDRRRGGGRHRRGRRSPLTRTQKREQSAQQHGRNHEMSGCHHLHLPGVVSSRVSGRVSLLRG
jgi:hypothetical protein